MTLVSTYRITCKAITVRTDSSTSCPYKQFKAPESLPRVAEKPQAQRGAFCSVHLLSHRKEVVRTLLKVGAALPPRDMCHLLPNTDIKVCPGLWFFELSSLPATSSGPSVWLLRYAQCRDMQ